MNDSILIIGNGPSTKVLADFGFHNLPESIDTFAMGAAYRYFERINWWPDYYAWCDVKVAHSHRDSFQRLIEDPKVTTRQFYFPLPVSNASRLEIVPHSSTGDFCFEKAVSLGYKTIYLIGIEGNYVEAIDGSRPMTDAEFDALNMRDVFDIYASIYKNREQAESNFRNNLRIIGNEITENPNYFFPDYQRKGDVFSAPRSQTHRNNWKKRAERCKRSNISVYNLSKASLIDDFSKKDFYEAIKAIEYKDHVTESNKRALDANVQPLVSIIIPIYNVQKYVQDCLISVKSQTYNNIEIIIVNDGSTDNSADIAQNVTSQWNNVKFINQKNLGLGGARNTGVMHASGSYITFLDSDDMIKNDHIASLINVISVNTDLDIVTGGCEFIDERGQKVDKNINTFKSYQTEFGTELTEADQLLGLYASSIACARLYRAEFLKSADLSFPNHLPHEDWFFTYKAFYKAGRTASTPARTYLYRIRENSLSSSISIKYADTIQNVFDDTFDFINENDFDQIAWDLFARRIVIVVNSILKRLQRSDVETRAKLANVFEKNYALIVSSYTRLRSGPLRKHWIPEQFIDLIDLEVKYANSNRTSHKYVAMAAPEFYFSSPSEKVSKLKNKFEGERCFIIGNGPSLNRHDLALIEDEFTFAVNSFFYKSQETGFTPTFYIVEDSKVVEERSEEINSCAYPYKIFPSIFRKKYIKDSFNVAYINMDQGFYKTSGPHYCIPRFSDDAADSVIAGQTVTYANMQLAYYMGFSEVYLIGMDFHYIIPAEHKILGNHILSTTDDPNHFHKDYFGVGKTWKDPKLDRVAMNYRLAKLAYEAVGRKIYNATIGGKLEIFDRVDYEALLRDPATGQKRSQRVSPLVVKLGEGTSAAAPQQLAKPSLVLAASSPGPQAAPGTTVALSAAPPQKQPEPTAAPIAGSSPAAPAPKPVTASVPASEALLADSPGLERKPIPQSPSAMSQSSATDITPPQPPQPRPWYAPTGDALRRVIPGLYPTLQDARRALWRLAGYPLAWMSGLGALGVLSWAAIAPGPFGGRMVVAGAALGALAVVGLGAMAWRLRRAIQTLSAENRRLAEDIALIHELAAGREGRVDRILEEQGTLKQDVGSIRTGQGRDGAALRSELAALKAARGEDAAALRQEMAGLKSAQARDVSTLQSTLSRTIEEARAGTQAALQAELKRLEAETGQVVGLLKAEIVSSGQATRTDAEAALRSELIRLKADQAETSKALRDEIARNGQEVRDSVDATLLAELTRLETVLAERASAEAAARREALSQLQAELDQKIKARAASTGASFGRAAQAALRRETALKEQIASLQAALSRIEDETASAQTAAAQGDAALREELQAVRQGLEQRLRAEIDEAMAQSVGELAERIEASARGAADDDAQLREDMAALREALEQRVAADVEAGKAEALANAEQRLAAELEALEQRLTSATGDNADALRQDISALQAALKGAADTAAAAQTAAAQGDAALREELQAVRQGLEQRLRAEIDEATRESVGALSERVEAAARTAGEADASLREDIQSLRTLVDADFKTPLEALQTASKQALEVATGVQKATGALRKNETWLTERMKAAERQIGALKYPDAPDVFVFFGHHKCGSRFFRNQVFGRIAESTGARVRSYKIANPPHHYSRLDDLDLPNIDFSSLGEHGRDVVLFANATERSLDKIRRTAGDWRGLRIIRDPRQVLVSNYFHHKGDHPFEAHGWIWDQLKHDKPILNELSKEDGILHELDHISRHVIEDLILASFDDERVLTLRLEDFSADPKAHLEQIASFLKVPDVAGIDLGATQANPYSGPWPQHFTSKIREVFKARYGQALIDLGYEEDMDW